MAAAAPARRAAPSRAPARAPRRAPARRRPPARQSPARRAPARRAGQRTPPAGQLIPLAVGRTAVAVRALPDSGLVVGMTRGRAWIAVLGTLLAGIVALNVMTLSLGASSGRIDQQIAGLEQEASALRAQLAERLSRDRVAAAASRLGMVAPAPGDITYLDAGGRATALASERLGSGFGVESSTLSATVVTPASPIETPSSPSTPATTTETPSLAASEPAVPVERTPAAPTTPTSTPAPPADSGGVAPG